MVEPRLLEGEVRLDGRLDYAASTKNKAVNSTMPITSQMTSRLDTGCRDPWTKALLHSESSPSGRSCGRSGPSELRSCQCPVSLIGESCHVIWCTGTIVVQQGRLRGQAARPRASRALAATVQSGENGVE